MSPNESLSQARKQVDVSVATLNKQLKSNNAHFYQLKDDEELQTYPYRQHRIHEKKGKISIILFLLMPYSELQKVSWYLGYQTFLGGNPDIFK